MIVRVNPSDPTPAYEQIRAQIATMAAHGTMPVGTRLPTIRQLAGDLGLAKGTVAKAYEELEREGVIETRGRHGSFVRGDVVDPGPRADARLAEAAEAFAVTVFQLGVDAGTAQDALAQALSDLDQATPGEGTRGRPVA